MGFNGKKGSLWVLFLSASLLVGCGGGSSSKSGSTVAPATSGSTAAPTSSGTVGSPTSGTTNTPTASLGAGPVLNTVQFDDVDGDDMVSKGDKLVATFVDDLEPVPAGLNPADEFELLVADDTFGAGATLESGPAANQVQITLGDEPRLYVSATFDPNKTTKGEASGINVSANATGQIRGLGEGAVQASAAPVDVSGTLTASFHNGASLNDPRGAHVSVTLDDGRVLVVGGLAGTKKEDLVTEAELYDPLTDSFVRVSDLSGEAGRMKRGKVNVGFFQGTAVKLKNGDVLISGGYGVEKKSFFGLGKTKVDTLESAFLFHPQTNTFERVGDMVTPRHSHTATLLDDGRVLIAGGYNDSLWSKSKSQAPLEVYDPANKRFEKLGKIFRRVKLQTPRQNHSAVALDNGNSVLFSGGVRWKGGALFGLIKPKLEAVQGSEALVGGSKTEKFGDMAESRLNHTSLEFAPYKVAAFGGHSLNGGAVATVEVFDANTGAWTSAGSLSTPRSGPLAAIVRNEVLVIGGHTGVSETDVVEVFQRDAGTMANGTYTLNTARNGCTVNTLADGRVLVIGGLSGSSASWLSLDGAPLASTEVYVSH